MNKKNIQICSALLLSLGITSANAALNTPLAKGAIDGSANKVAKISLNPVANQSFFYDIICNITATNGARFPTVIQYEFDDLQVVGMFPVFSFDGATTSYNQVKLADATEHNMTLHNVSGSSIQADSYVQITWVASDDMSSPTSYTCYATPTLGRKK